MKSNFFNELLQNTDSRIAPAKSTSRYLLDKNEQSDDVDISIKMKVLDSLLRADWNRYPSADNRDIETLVANYCSLDPVQIVLGPGSASIITTLLNYFALNKRQIVIAQPTYTLFDYHCKTYGIEYQPWYLTPDLEYDYDNMPQLSAGSLLVITTPNNPVGNTFSREKLENILASNPDSVVLIDAVYAEFCEMEFAPLVRKYENLMVLRSFSKAFPIAGLRLGYLCAAPLMAANIKKLMLQFSINHFTLVFAREMLFKPEFMKRSQQRVEEIIEEREWMYRSVNSRFGRNELKVFKSAGNFLLIRIFDDAAFSKLMADFDSNGIKVLNTSPFPLLQNTFRVSIGKPHENETFIECLRDSLRNKRPQQHLQVEFSEQCHQLKKVHTRQLVGSY